ncbi:MAG: hypothetical protein ACWGN2_07755, partial [Anaerolineales bacterium]
LFPLQDFAEQTRGRLIISDSAQAEYYLDLAMQRTEDLETLGENQLSIVVIGYLNRALDQAIAAIIESPEEDLLSLVEQLRLLVLNIDVAISKSNYLPAEQNVEIENLRAKTATLASILAKFSGKDQLVSILGEGQISSDFSLAFAEGADQNLLGIAPQIIEFPEGSPGAEHEFFPLVGEHADLDCLSCHTDAQYAGTPNLCVDCHLEVLPDPHFDSECSLCHSPTSWQDISFDHNMNIAADCQSCHMDDRMSDHYFGQCSACHNTVDWAQVDFNHQAVDTKDCQSCHSDDKPANHYQGQCSLCHNTTNWAQVNFNHEAVKATDCKSCHSNVKPANHYSGQCSACHNTSNWSQANFNHEVVGATDCKSCHSGNKPGNHWGGQCSACHNTNSWSNARFNHGAIGATDCKSCHSGNKPANHFSGQCSQCHTTSSWSGASFNHSFSMNHGGANGNCSKCHPSGGAKYSCFSCHDQTKMTKKHNEEGISNFGSRCLDCHRRGGESGGRGEDSGSGGDSGGGESSGGGEEEGGGDD